MSELINNREKRIETLKEIILHLHRGEAPEAVRGRLAELVREADAGEIAAMEERLMAEGMTVEEVRSMCDLHAQVLGDIARPVMPERMLPPGHPVDTFRRENLALQAEIARMRPALAEATTGAGREVEPGRGERPGASPEPLSEILRRLRESLNGLMDVEKHYARKENLLFSALERHGITGPSKVMWAKDDEVRGLLKALDEALRQDGIEADELAVVADAIAAPAIDAVESMIFKEEKILLPMALGTLTEEEWGEIWSESPRFGWCLVEPGEGYRPPEPEVPPDPLELPGGRAVALGTGNLTAEQLIGLFSALPVDLTFVDAEDRVAFFSEGPDRIFARSRAIIGRKVQHCHPPKSVHIVERIVDDFRSGRQSVAEFWIELRGRFVHIRYFAVRDAQGAYLGTLEVTQDITGIRKLQGERRLLSYDPALPEGDAPSRVGGDDVPSGAPRGPKP